MFYSLGTEVRTFAAFRQDGGDTQVRTYKRRERLQNPEVLVEASRSCEVLGVDIVKLSAVQHLCS